MPEMTEVRIENIRGMAEWQDNNTDREDLCDAADELTRLYAMEKRAAETLANTERLSLSMSATRHTARYILKGEKPDG